MSSTTTGLDRNSVRLYTYDHDQVMNTPFDYQNIRVLELHSNRDIDRAKFELTRAYLEPCQTSMMELFCENS